MSRPRLKPCPLCDSTDLFTNRRGVIGCNNCGASGSMEYDDVNARRVWNKRSAEDRLEAESTRLRAALQAIADAPKNRNPWRKATWQMAQEALHEIAAGAILDSEAGDK